MVNGAKAGNDQIWVKEVKAFKGQGQVRLNINWTAWRRCYSWLLCVE